MYHLNHPYISPKYLVGTRKSCAWELNTYRDSASNLRKELNGENDFADSGSAVFAASYVKISFYFDIIYNILRVYIVSAG